MMGESKQNIDVEKIVKHWVDTSEEDFKTMLTLYDSKSYGWALFLGHISVEKLLKALFVRRFKEHAPLTHNLFRLAELLEIEMPNDYADWLDEITSFNLNARYDDYKREFYKLCTDDYTRTWVENIIHIRIWIKQML
jgi:HEPN domain-containing protein